MRFSLTGDLPEARLLLQSIGQTAGCSVACVHSHGALQQQWSQELAPAAVVVSSAEEALVAGGVDAVIVAVADTEESLRLVRHASQSGHAVVVIPPEDLSTAWSYELHLLLDESEQGIVPLTARWYLPAAPPSADGEAEWELGLPAVVDDPRHARTVMHAIDLAAALGFADSQVTVLGDDEQAAEQKNRRVILSEPGTDAGSRPSVTINCSRAARPFVLQRRMGGTTDDFAVVLPDHVQQLPDGVVHSAAGHVVAALQQRERCQQAMLDLSRTLQVAEAMARSIRRRRTIDVHQDELTERAIFKTQMTAMGCGVLTWLFLGLVGYLLVGQLLKPADIVMQVLRGLWILPVVLFLVAQFLLPLARGRQA